MSVRIRPTREDDAPALPALEQSAGQVFRTIADLAWIADDGNQPPDAHLAFLRAGTSWVAVDAGDRPIGFLCAERHGAVLHIKELAIRHDLQRRGLGRALVEHAIAWARAAGLAAVTLTTFRDIAWNEPFYRRLGFATLAPEQLDADLVQVLGHEAELGLPAERRCAMRLDLC